MSCKLSTFLHIRLSLSDVSQNNDIGSCHCFIKLPNELTVCTVLTRLTWSTCNTWPGQVNMSVNLGLTLLRLHSRSHDKMYGICNVAPWSLSTC